MLNCSVIPRIATVFGRKILEYLKTTVNGHVSIFTIKF
jgi:hypothetical protein